MKPNRLLIFAIPLLLFPSVTAQADKIDDYITSEMQKRQIPGLALAVVKNGEVIKTKGYGLANVELNVPVTPDSVFELASITKQFTATAIMLLVEEGKVGVDDKIKKYLTDAPETWNGITVRHLLTHTGGLEDDFWPQFNSRWFADYTTAEKFASASKLPVRFAPGDRWQYTDQGYFLLGMIIEKVSGQRYREFLTKRIFQPLRMTATTVKDQWQIVKNRASGYTLRHGKLAHVRRDVQDELPASYGLLSTVKDLAQWDAALYTEKILKKSSMGQMWTPVRLDNGFGHNYGFGWYLGEVRGHNVVSHGGITGTFILRLPDDALTVIVLTNLHMRSGTNPRLIALRVAGFYIPELLVSSLKEQPDPDPQVTQKMKNVLSEIASGVKDPSLVTPELKAMLTPLFRRRVASWIENMKFFTFVACDDVSNRQTDRFGVRVSRICYYKQTSPVKTRYYWFYLTADGEIAALWSNTE